MADFQSFLSLMVEKEASDLFFYANAIPHMRVHGLVYPVGNTRLSSKKVEEIGISLMGVERHAVFEKELESNFAICSSTNERFRVNIFKQQSNISIVIRYIKARIPSFTELGLPSVLEQLVMKKRGLILLVGATGCGKSTTLAAMTDYRNSNTKGHILTIEDPIEFTHKHKKSIIGQREVGIDTHSYGHALRNAMRESPDVLLIGEILDAATMAHALSFSKTGHLCLSTLHSNNCTQTLDRILGFFPHDAKAQILMDLSLNLVAIISQRLVTGHDGKRLPATEILLPTPFIRELIEKGDFDEVVQAMNDAKEPGMQTFDQSLLELFNADLISREEALLHVDQRSDLALTIRLSG